MPTYYLTKTLTSSGNSFGFSGTDVTLDFDASVTKVKENLDKKIGATILRPRSRSSYNNYPTMTIMIDLKQLKWVFQVDGVLANDSSNITNLSPTTTAIAVNKKNALIAMMEQGGNCKWYHRNFGGTRPAFPSGFEQATTYEPVQILTVNFEDEETEVGTSEAEMKGSEQRISFSMTLQKGQDRVKV